MALQNINYAIEQSIVNYLSSSFYTTGSFLNQLQVSGSNVQFYSYVSNQDKLSEEMQAQAVPVVVVKCQNANEVIYSSRVYEMQVEVSCLEIAADTTIFGQLPEYVFNEFVASPTASINFTNNVVSVYQVRINGFDEDIDTDTIKSVGNFTIIGGLI